MTTLSTRPTTEPALPANVDPERLEAGLRRLIENQRPRYRRLWAYFRNPLRICPPSSVVGQGSERPYRQAQEWGLPPRITGVCAGAEPFADSAVTGRARKEVVIENDIGWRVETLVDYLFGKPLILSSAAPDPRRRELIGRLLRAILEHNGGVQFLQQLATLGAVHGFVDVLVKYVAPEEALVLGTPVNAGDDDGTEKASPRDLEGSGAQDGTGPGGAGDRASAGNGETDARVERVARTIRFEIVEPARALPLLSKSDYRAIDAYAQVWDVDVDVAAGGDVSAMSVTNAARGTWWDRLRAIFGGAVAVGETRRDAHRTSGRALALELITADHWYRLDGAGRVVEHGANSLGRVPVVHVQNTAEAFAYSGASDVEPLMPLQDELNTRLSDRAHRITLQSFKMYLARGLEHFTDQPVAPGRMWLSDNPDAAIDEFGGDTNCPSEEAHIADLREAMDKASGVSPIAAGAIKNRIGRLTSAAALRVTLLALLSKTDKKRTLYGGAIERMCELALAWLDAAGLFRTTAEERRVEIDWPSPLPENELEKLTEAEAKLRLGVDREIVLKELGY